MSIVVFLGVKLESEFFYGHCLHDDENTEKHKIKFKA